MEQAESWIKKLHGLNVLPFFIMKFQNSRTGLQPVKLRTCNQ